jgi:homoserine kinase type II
MKLTKKEIQKVANEFELGTIKSYKIIKGGLVNYNYLVKTGKGNYIIRIIGNVSPKKIKHIKLQFKILDHLKKKKFPYLIPYHIKTKHSKDILDIGNKKVWVYEMIAGQNYDMPNVHQIKLMAKALAIYHQFISGLNGEESKDESEKRIIMRFKKMQKIIIRDDADRLALKYRDFFKEVFNNVRKIKNPPKQLFLHNDFDSSNVLFRKGKLVGIIDFDETSYGPRIFDISVSIRDSCSIQGKLDMKKVKIFLKEYEKISNLSKKEKDMIIPSILNANVDFFVWTYVEMKKEKENRKKYMKETVDLTKDIIENKRVIR